MVIAISITESGERCGTETLTAVAIGLGFRFAAFAYLATQFFLVLLKLIKPNAFAVLDMLFLWAETACAIYLIIIFATKGSDCSKNESLVYVALIIGLVHGVKGILFALGVTVSFFTMFGLVLAKKMTYEQAGDALEFTATFGLGDEPASGNEETKREIL